jgi:hypothetical protein
VIFGYGIKFSVPVNKFIFALSLLIVSLALVNITLVYIISAASAQTAKTFEGITSDGKCHDGGFHNIERSRPEYAEVDPKKPLRTIEGTIGETHVSYEDAPWTHTSHDFVWYVKLDPAFKNLNSESNRPKNSPNVNDKTMEMEWEIGSANDGSTDRFPKEFWPSAGDRVWMIGRYIFDCGHPPARTELHPPSAVAFTHFEPIIFGSPGSEPILAAKTTMYIHGDGGPIYKTPIGGKSYEFNVTLPTKPSPSSRLLYKVMDTPFGGPSPIITGPFAGPGPSNNHIHVNYDLRSINPSHSHRFGSHIAAGWTDPPQSNVYHYLTISFDSVTKTPAKTPRGLGSISARLYGAHTWDNLWVNVNGQYVELLNPANGFKSYSETDKKILSSKPSINTIVAERGAGSTLDIETTGWLISHAHNDPCFGEFNTIDLTDRLHDWPLILSCGVTDQTSAESLGSVDQQFPLGNAFDRTVAVGPHTGVCSEKNHVLGSQCEFTLDFTVKDGGSIVVTPTPTPAPVPTPTPAPVPTPTPSPTCDPNAKMIKKGATGAKVTELQFDLTQLGYGKLLGKHGPNLDGIDGKFGDDTRKTVIKFQQDKHLKKIDGLVGPETWGAICESLSTLTPTSLIKETKAGYHQVTFVTPSAIINEMAEDYHPISLEQESGSTNASNLSPEAEEESENDFPGIDFKALNSNLTETQIAAANETKSLTMLPDLVCNDGTASDINGLCADGSSPQLSSTNVTTPISTAEQLICSDGTAPDITTGLCADGSQPQSQVLNATVSPSPDVTTPEQQLVCSDGTAPDVTTGLCADGSQPQAFNATASQSTAPVPEQQLVCSDGTAPDVTTGLCADGSQPQPFNATAPGVTTAEQQLVCADGTGPDPTTGLCADGSQP